MISIAYETKCFCVVLEICGKHQSVLRVVISDGWGVKMSSKINERGGEIDFKCLDKKAFNLYNVVRIFHRSARRL